MASLASCRVVHFFHILYNVRLKNLYSHNIELCAAVEFPSSTNYCVNLQNNYSTYIYHLQCNTTSQRQLYVAHFIVYLRGHHPRLSLYRYILLLCCRQLAFFDITTQCRFFFSFFCEHLFFSIKIACYIAAVMHILSFRVKKTQDTVTAAVHIYLIGILH